MSESKPADAFRIDPVRADELESFLPLIEAYQRFYEVTDIDRGRNRGFFGRLIAPSQLGLLLGAWRRQSPIGFACMNWSLDSLKTRETVTLNDLWVAPAERRAGVGRALIEAAADQAHARGSHSLVWITAPDNYEARGLYNSLATEQSEWIHYELRLRGPGGGR